MKTINVVAAVICDSIKEKSRYLQQQEVMEILKGDGNFQVERLKKVKLLSRPLLEK